MTLMIWCSAHMAELSALFVYNSDNSEDIFDFFAQKYQKIYEYCKFALFFQYQVVLGKNV